MLVWLTCLRNLAKAPLPVVSHLLAEANGNECNKQYISSLPSALAGGTCKKKQGL